MKKLNFAMGIVLLTSNTWAADVAVDFTGNWKGPGTITSTKTQPADCQLVEIEIEHHNHQMTIKRYKAQCGAIAPNWGPYTMKIVNNKVFEGDGDEEVEIGEIKNDTMLTLSTDGGVQYAFNLKLVTGEKGSKTLATYYGVRNALGAIVIEGNLKAF